MSVPLGPNVIWLDDIAYPLARDVSTSHLATFPTRVTFGDPTARDDEFLSTWAIRSIPGGVGIEDYDEGSDAERIWWASLDTRYTHGLTLPPLVTATRPSTVSSTATSYPLGVIGTQHYTLFVDGATITAFGWDEEDEDWLEPGTANTIAAAPVGKPVTFQGTNAGPMVFVPHGGSSGYSILAESDAGTGALTITAVDGTDAAEPDGPIAFCRFIVGSVSQLYALDSDGSLWLSATTGATATWSQPTNVDGAVALDGSETPKHLLVFRTRSGQAALHAVTDRGVWVYNSTIPCFERTEFVMAPHPENARAATVWRPGEHLHITQGLERWQLTSADVYIPNTGPARDDGVPAQFRGTLVDLEPEVSFLFALLVGSSEDAFAETFVEDGGMWYDDATYLAGDAAFSALLCDTSLGWHVLWESADPVALTWGTVAGISPGYALWWGGDAGDVYRLPLRAPFHNARQGAKLGIDTFAPTGYFITGWFDAAMLSFTKIAADLSVTMDRATVNEYVDVFYQIDEDEVAWTLLGRVEATGRTLLPFGDDGNGFAAGLAFDRIRLRFDFARDPATDTLSPVMIAFALHFLKIPQDAQTFEVEIDLARQNWQGVPADTMRDRLAALLTRREFFIMQHARRRYRTLLTRLTGWDAAGQDEKGMRTLTLLALERLDDAEAA